MKHIVAACKGLRRIASEHTELTSYHLKSHEMCPWNEVAAADAIAKARALERAQVARRFHLPPRWYDNGSTMAVWGWMMLCGRDSLSKLGLPPVVNDVIAVAPRLISEIQDVASEYNEKHREKAA